MGAELLDVYDERGHHAGVKPRDDVHRDGDWHRAFHLWVASPEGVLLQRRARDKASWPGYLDATAAGHLVAGEAIADGLREAEEELGVAYAFDTLADLGVHRVQDGPQDGLVNRELQHVFAVRDDRALSAWTAFDRGELDGLVLVSHDAFAALVAALRDGTELTEAGRAWDGTRERRIDVTASEIVPAPYLTLIAAALARIGNAGAVGAQHD